MSQGPGPCLWIGQNNLYVFELDLRTHDYSRTNETSMVLFLFSGEVREKPRTWLWELQNIPLDPFLVNRFFVLNHMATFFKLMKTLSFFSWRHIKNFQESPRNFLFVLHWGVFIYIESWKLSTYIGTRVFSSIFLILKNFEKKFLKNRKISEIYTRKKFQNFHNIFCAKITKILQPPHPPSPQKKTNVYHD